MRDQGPSASDTQTRRLESEVVDMTKEFNVSPQSPGADIA